MQMRIILVFYTLLLVVLGGCSTQTNIPSNLAHIRSIEELSNMFPENPAFLEQAAEEYIKRAQKLITDIQKIPDNQRTFANTVQAYDYIVGMSDISIFFQLLYAVTYVYPQQEMRDTARKLLARVETFLISVRQQLCNAITTYAENKTDDERLTQAQQYFLQITLDEFKRAGYYLPATEYARLTELHDEIITLSNTYVGAINEDKSCIIATADELAGLEADFIAGLPQDEQGNYILSVDKPVMSRLTNSATRKRLWFAYENRAYPHNDETLHAFIAKRHELAKLLGFSSYAAFDLAGQMAETPERAQAFIDNIIARTQQKVEQECDLLIAHLPEGICLSPEGKLYPWDRQYVSTLVKQKEFNINECEIAEYFPLEHALQGMLNIYAQFFSLRFETEPFKNIWTEKLTLLTVYKQEDPTPIGYVILDLFERPDKYKLEIHLDLLPATYTSEGNLTRATSLVIANLTPAQGDKPALFTRYCVMNFFHEFGHALHHILGRTELSLVSGTRVKRDFVEMPSQMLEEWIYDGPTLKSLGRHYKTGEPLPDELIAKIQKLKNFDSGRYTQWMTVRAILALTLFGADQPINDLEQIWKTLSKRIVTYETASDDSHWYAAFLHLANYGAKFYGYTWSQVFARDLFKEIKKNGLLNPATGTRYIEQVIGRGGSADPLQLLRDFLGRDPNDEAFFEDMGL